MAGGAFVPGIGVLPLHPFAPPSLEHGVAPGAGNRFIKAVGDGHWWALLYVYVTLTTSAAAGARVMQLDINDGNDDSVTTNLAGFSISASDALSYSFQSTAGTESWVDGGTAAVVPLAPLLLQPSWRFEIDPVNLDTADTLTNIAYVVQKFYPPRSADFDPPGA